jgi:hypothetical protein
LKKHLLLLNAKETRLSHERAHKLKAGSKSDIFDFSTHMAALAELHKEFKASNMEVSSGPRRAAVEQNVRRWVYGGAALGRHAAVVTAIPCVPDLNQK